MVTNVVSHFYIFTNLFFLLYFDLDISSFKTLKLDFFSSSIEFEITKSLVLYNVKLSNYINSTHIIALKLRIIYIYSNSLGSELDFLN